MAALLGACTLVLISALVTVGMRALAPAVPAGSFPRPRLAGPVFGAPAAGVAPVLEGGLAGGLLDLGAAFPSPSVLGRRFVAPAPRDGLLARRPVPRPRTPAPPKAPPLADPAPSVEHDPPAPDEGGAVPGRPDEAAPEEGAADDDDRGEGDGGSSEERDEKGREHGRGKASKGQGHGPERAASGRHGRAGDGEPEDRGRGGRGDD